MAEQFHICKGISFAIFHIKRNGFRIIFQPPCMYEKGMVEEYMVEMSEVDMFGVKVWG